MTHITSSDPVDKAKPAAAATPKADAWSAFESALSNVVRIDADALTDAIESLGEASQRLDELDLDWGELADLIVELEGAMEIVSKVESQVFELATRSPSDWPKASTAAA